MHLSDYKPNKNKQLKELTQTQLSSKEEKAIKSQLKKDKMLAIVYCKNVLGYSLEESVNIINSFQ